MQPQRQEEKDMFVFQKQPTVAHQSPSNIKKQRSYLENMENKTIKYASSNKSLIILKIPNFLKNIAAVQKPEKQEIMKNQISKFESKCKDFLLTTFLLFIKKVHKHYLQCFDLSIFII